MYFRRAGNPSFSGIAYVLADIFSAGRVDVSPRKAIWPDTRQQPIKCSQYRTLKTLKQLSIKVNLNEGSMIKYVLTELGWAGQENIWLSVILHGLYLYAM